MEVYDMSPKVMGQSHEIMLALNQKKKKKKAALHTSGRFWWRLLTCNSLEYIFAATRHTESALNICIVKSA